MRPAIHEGQRTGHFSGCPTLTERNDHLSHSIHNLIELAAQRCVCMDFA
jgi:hypothetical protein